MIVAESAVIAIFFIFVCVRKNKMPLYFSIFPSIDKYDFWCVYFSTILHIIILSLTLSLCSKNIANTSETIHTDTGSSENHSDGDGLLWSGKDGQWSSSISSYFERSPSRSMRALLHEKWHWCSCSPSSSSRLLSSGYAIENEKNLAGSGDGKNNNFSF